MERDKYKLVLRSIIFSPHSLYLFCLESELILRLWNIQTFQTAPYTGAVAYTEHCEKAA
jgi:hypothetical protein